jgi:molecular chaperone GrpE
LDGPRPAREAEEVAAAEEAVATDRGEAEKQAAEPEVQPEPEEDPLTVVQRERDEYLDLAKRTQADFENYRKRAAKEAAAAGARARSGLIREILPVVDNLERALASADGAGETFVEGVRLVYNELQGVLARAGVEAIEPAGEQFDPTVHEALSTREADGAEAGVVLDVVEKGYRTGDTVIRPARVVVAA